MKIFFLILIFYSIKVFSVFANTKLSHYKDYKITNINLQLEEIAQGLNYPWGMTFIDDETLLITEKKGGLYKVNINLKTKEIIDHNLEIIAIRQGGLLDVLYHTHKIPSLSHVFLILSYPYSLL